MKKIANQQTMREINKSLLLNLLYQYGPLSRIDLSRRTKLSPTTVSVLMDEIIKEGVVYESGIAGSGVGRKSTMLSIREDHGYVLGVDLSNSPSRCVLLNLRGKVMATQPLKRLIGEESLRGELPELIRRFIADQQVGVSEVCWIGISVPGRISANREMVSSDYLGIENIPLKKIIGDRFGLPVNLVNDLDAAGFAERFSGAAKGKETIVYILIDYGTGAGFVLQNQIFRGSTGRAGTTKELYPFGTERLGGGFKERFPAMFGGFSPEQAIQAFVRLGLEGLEPYAAELDRIIGTIANYCGMVNLLIDTEQLIMNGWITENEMFFKRLIGRIHEYEGRTPKTPVEASYWKGYGAAVGAATLGLHQMFRMKAIV